MAKDVKLNINCRPFEEKIPQTNSYHLGTSDRAVKDHPVDNAAPPGHINCRPFEAKIPDTIATTVDKDSQTVYRAALLTSKQHSKVGNLNQANSLSPDRHQGEIPTSESQKDTGNGATKEAENSKPENKKTTVGKWKTVTPIDNDPAIRKTNKNQQSQEDPNTSKLREEDASQSTCLGRAKT